LSEILNIANEVLTFADDTSIYKCWTWWR